MCLGIPGKVVGFSPDHQDLGRVDVQGVIRDVNLALLEDDPAQPGDWVLIHLGFALQKMTEAEVADALAVTDEIYAAAATHEPHPGATP